MTDGQAATKVYNNEAHSRFEIRVGGQAAFIHYRRDQVRIVFIHTEVPPALEGQGIASRLARAALDFARENHLKVVPLCPFVSSYIRRHPEYEPLIGKP